MYRNVKSIKETLLKWGLKTKDANAVTRIIETILKKQVNETAKTTRNVPVKANGKSMIDISQISEDRYTIQPGNTKYIVPVKTGLEKVKLGEDFRFNDDGILLYSGKDTENYVNEIAKKHKLDPAKIVLPTKDETDKMYNDKDFRKALRDADILWIPFIIDKKDETRNVSLKEYWKNPDKYHFGDRDIGDGLWCDNDPDNYLYNTAVVLGLKK